MPDTPKIQLLRDGVPVPDTQPYDDPEREYCSLTIEGHTPEPWCDISLTRKVYCPNTVISSDEEMARITALEDADWDWFGISSGTYYFRRPKEATA